MLLCRFVAPLIVSLWQSCLRYAYPVNNSAYTNVVAGIALNFAAEAAALLGYKGSVYEDFSTKAAQLVVPFSQQVPGTPDASPAPYGCWRSRRRVRMHA